MSMPALWPATANEWFWRHVTHSLLHPLTLQNQWYLVQMGFKALSLDMMQVYVSKAVFQLQLSQFMTIFICTNLVKTKKSRQYLLLYFGQDGNLNFRIILEFQDKSERSNLDTVWLVAKVKWGLIPNSYKENLKWGQITSDGSRQSYTA